MKIFISTTLLCLLFAATIPADEIDPIRILEQLRLTPPAIEARWQLVRTIYPDKGLAAALELDEFQDGLRVNNDELTKRLEAAIRESANSGKTIKIDLDASIVTPTRFAVTRLFNPETDPVEFTYKIDNGNLYVENVTSRRLEILPESDSFRAELFRGLPEYVITGEVFESLKDAKATITRKNDIIEATYKVGNGLDYFIELDLKSMILRRYEAYFNDKLVFSTVSEGQTSCGGRLLPLKVTVKRYKNGLPSISEVWTLEACGELDLTSVDLKAKLLPGYWLLDKTGAGAGSAD